MSHITFLHKSFAFILSIVILMGTVGISADFHICQGKIKSFSFFGQAEKCTAMEQGNVCTSTDDKETIARKKCCSNQSIQETASFQSNVIGEPISIGTAVIIPWTSLFLEASMLMNYHPMLDYDDPPITRHSSTLVIAHQSFLI